LKGFTARHVPDQAGRRFLITGASAGIGWESARLLALRGAEVIMACRDVVKGEKAKAAILAEAPGARLSVLHLDLADLASVRAAAAQVERIDVLINNAGVMNPPLHRTAQGFELQFGTNHLGHFALTGLLLPRIAGPDPRVVTVASIAHGRGRIDFANLDGARGYSRFRFYGQSKLANLLFMAELDRRLREAGSPVQSMGCHPGISGTTLGRFSVLDKAGLALASVLFHKPPEAAVPTLQAATDPDLTGGAYVGPQGFMEASGPSGPARRSRTARDPDVARRLWQVSVELTGIDPGI
jgi:NAD(P)-dependent dehydrogenase (short-subunit alcohol dehydrogenase family)